MLIRRKPEKIESALLLFLFPFAGCSSENDSGPGALGSSGSRSEANAGAPGTNQPGGGEGGGEPAEEPPLYLIASDQFFDDGALGNIVAVSSLDAGQEVDYGRGLEIPGGAAIFGQPKSGAFLVGAWETPELQRYTLGADRRFTKGATPSFAGRGVTGVPGYPGHLPFASDNKAYLLDSEGLQLVAFDPEKMELRDSIDLGPVAQREGWRANFGDAIQVRGNRLFFGVSWSDMDGLRTFDSVRLVQIDTAKDEVVGYEDSDACGDIYTTNQAQDGTLYFGSFANRHAIRGIFGEGYGSAGCQLRVVPPESAFDQGYTFELSSLTGGLPAGQFILVSEGVGFLRAYYPDEVNATPENWEKTRYAPGYRWWRWELGAKKAAEIAGQELAVAGGLVYDVDGRKFVTNSAADYSETTLVELDPEGAVRDGVTVRGYPYGVLRVR